MDEQRYGGEWSDEKLRILRDYLERYLQIFHANERAKHLNPIYVDGFAGCGTRTPRDEDAAPPDLLESEADRAEARAGVAFFFKQWGTWGPDGIKRSKSRNGRMLDGAVFDEMPRMAIAG